MLVRCNRYESIQKFLVLVLSVKYAGGAGIEDGEHTAIRMRDCCSNVAKAYSDRKLSRNMFNACRIC